MKGQASLSLSFHFPFPVFLSYFNLLLIYFFPFLAFNFLMLALSFFFNPKFLIAGVYWVLSHSLFFLGPIRIIGAMLRLFCRSHQTGLHFLYFIPPQIKKPLSRRAHFIKTSQHNLRRKGLLLHHWLKWIKHGCQALPHGVAKLGHAQQV